MTIDDSMVGEVALGWFKELGYAISPSPQMDPGEMAAELGSYLALVGRLYEAMHRLKPAIPLRAITTLRDTLLPKLLSGELQVPIARQLIEAQP